MFEQLQSRLGEIFTRLRGRGTLSPDDVDGALREVRLALLEADVNFKVARDLADRVREAAVGQEIWKSLTPGQRVVQIVFAELTRILGATHRPLQLAPTPPTVILLVGLHGTGKTTTAGKLALHLKKQGRTPLLAAADVYRPAAVAQLQVVGQTAGVPVFALEGAADPVEVARAALDQARRTADVLIIDSAGRLHIDDGLLAELARIREATAPHNTLLVLDAMAGQDAVASRILASSARDRKSTRLNSSHTVNSYAVFCLKKKSRDHRSAVVITATWNRRRRDGSAASPVALRAGCVWLRSSRRKYTL